MRVLDGAPRDGAPPWVACSRSETVGGSRASKRKGAARLSFEQMGRTGADFFKGLWTQMKLRLVDRCPSW